MHNQVENKMRGTLTCKEKRSDSGYDLQDRRARGRNGRRGVTELTCSMTGGAGLRKKRLNSESCPVEGSHVGVVGTAFVVLVIAPDAPMPEKITNSPEPSP